MRVATLLAAAVLSAVPVLAAHREVHLRQDVKLQGSVIPAGILPLPPGRLAGSRTAR